MPGVNNPRVCQKALLLLDGAKARICRMSRLPEEQSTGELILMRRLNRLPEEQSTGELIRHRRIFGSAHHQQHHLT